MLLDSLPAGFNCWFEASTRGGVISVVTEFMVDVAGIEAGMRV
jgi:hypothetical protein